MCKPNEKKIVAKQEHTLQVPNSYSYYKIKVYIKEICN